METLQKETVAELLELMNRVNYFETLKPNNDSFAATLKISSYAELQVMISALLKGSITLLQTETSGKAFPDAMVLVEMALQLLPNDEMELLDVVRRVGLNS
ncbi:hypothetical protein [Flavobacterium hungaricum]|nr:hypothetical protein [Flavobacterium hungaricum]